MKILYENPGGEGHDDDDRSNFNSSRTTVHWLICGHQYFDFRRYIKRKYKHNNNITSITIAAIFFWKKYGF